MKRFSKIPESLTESISLLDNVSAKPCKIVLMNGEVFENVYLLSSKSLVELWGSNILEAKAKDIFDISEVKEISRSPNQLPNGFVKEIDSFNETGMGFKIVEVCFKGLFSSSQFYASGSTFDFIELPEGK